MVPCQLTCFPHLPPNSLPHRQGGSALLAKAKKLSPSITERYALYVREQDKLARMSREQNADSSMDSASFAEFQNNYNAVVKHHKKALASRK